MIPNFLRLHLERLGAAITPEQNGATTVQVPGADNSFRFLPNGDVLTLQHDLPDLGWHPQHFMAGDVERAAEGDNEALNGYVLHNLVLARHRHDGPTHHVILTRGVSRGGELYHHITLGIAGNRKEGTPGNEWTWGFSDDHVHQSYYNRPHPEVEHLTRNVFLGHTPIEVLVDRLAEDHDIPAAEKFARAFAAAVKVV